MSWDYLRDRYTTAKAAVDAADTYDGLGAEFTTHPTVRAALAQIDMAERAITAIAKEMLYEGYE